MHEVRLPVLGAIRLLMLPVAKEKRLPFVVEVPNAATRQAMAELDAGSGKRCATAAEMLSDRRVLRQLPAAAVG